jgi:aerobic-type carbon monoxide dehydrogenase small subunit (CoxS/CutS family)
MEETTITLTVNGRTSSFSVDKDTTLLELLRDRLDLTGAKLGCGYGKCGTCTVVVNGEAKRSCIVKAARIDGATVLTIEGLSEGFTLHPIQEAFVEAYAIQCGFCTPGIVMTLYALYTKNPGADDATVKEQLNKHLCRCTGYENISRAALLAREKLTPAH